MTEFYGNNSSRVRGSHPMEGTGLVWHDTSLCVWDDSFMCETWLVHDSVGKEVIQWAVLYIFNGRYYTFSGHIPYQVILSSGVFFKWCEKWYDTKRERRSQHEDPTRNSSGRGKICTESEGQKVTRGEREVIWYKEGKKEGMRGLPIKRYLWLLVGGPLVHAFSNRNTQHKVPKKTIPGGRVCFDGSVGRGEGDA